MFREECHDRFIKNREEYRSLPRLVENGGGGEDVADELKQLTTLEEFYAEEHKLRDPAHRHRQLCQLQRAGWHNVNTATKAAMRVLMSEVRMAKFNKDDKG